MTLKKTGDIKAAEREFLKAIKIAPGDIDIIYSLGMFYLEKGQMKKANKQLEKLIRISPDNEMTIDLKYALEAGSEDNSGN